MVWNEQKRIYLPVQATCCEPQLGCRPPVALGLVFVDDFLHLVAGVVAGIDANACNRPRTKDAVADARVAGAHIMGQYAHNQLIFVKRDVILLCLCDVMLDAPEDEGLEASVDGVIRLEKETQDFTLHTSASVST